MAQPLISLFQDLTDRTMTNCTFLFPGDTNLTLAAHQNVLAAVSPVFKAMFYGPLAENSDGNIEITDIPYESYQKLLRIIYGQDVMIQDANDAFHLYNSSEKYNIPAVRKIAREYMLQTKNTTNAPLYHKAGTLFRDDELKLACTELFTSTIYNVTKVDTFFEATDAMEDSDLRIGEHEAHAVVEGLMDEVEREDDLKVRICKTLGLIRLLTTVTGQLFESIIPSNTAKFECSLNLVLPNEVDGGFGKLNKVVMPILNCQHCGRHLNFFSAAQMPKRCPCTRRPTHDSYGCEVRSVVQKCKAEYGKALEMIEKYKTGDISKYSLEDVKALHEAFKEKL